MKNNWNCNNVTSSNNMYIGRVPELSPYTSDYYLSPPLQADLLDARACSSPCPSSESDTSELECQTLSDITIYSGITSAAPTVDTSLLFPHNQAIYSQQLSLMPLLIQPETQQHKVLSHHPLFYHRHQNMYQAVHATDVSLHPATDFSLHPAADISLHPTTSYYNISPIMSTECAFQTSFGYYPYACSYIRATSNIGTGSTTIFNSPYEQQTNYDTTPLSSKRVKYEQQQQQKQQQGPSKQVNYHLTNKTNNCSSNRIFPCTEPNCNKLFTRPYNLKSHMRTHTHERPYSCHYKPCNWKFARPHDLKRHELQHSGLKPHSCNFCHRSFARSDALKRHWKVDSSCSQALQEDLLNGGQESSSASNKKKRSFH